MTLTLTRGRHTFFEKFAEKYFEEAQGDIERAKRTVDHKDFPEAVFHAQQCVEKAVKSMIEVERKYVYNHGVAERTVLECLF